jgi:hypothetical protein
VKRHFQDEVHKILLQINITQPSHPQKINSKYEQHWHLPKCKTKNKEIIEEKSS